MKQFFEKLHAVQTLSESVDKFELKRLAAYLTTEYECEEELEDQLLYFFSLNGEDVEYVLRRMRKQMRQAYPEDEQGTAFTQKHEKQIRAMVRQLNQRSLEQTNKPFHLSAALGELKIGTKEAKSFGMDVEGFVPRAEQAAAQKSWCPEGFYPRYVGNQWPWKLKMSFRTRTYRRKEDVGCHFQHGPFKGVIKGWVTFSPTVALMVLLQGWGFKLAANNHHFFYKWWFVAMVGLTPYTCQLLLFSRRY